MVKLFLNKKEYPKEFKKHPTKQVVDTSIEEEGKISEEDALELMGGGVAHNNIRNIKFFKLDKNNDIISMKYSKQNDRDPNYWYGVTPSSINTYQEFNISYIALIMGNEGVVKIPVKIFEEYISIAKKAHHLDGKIKHYHILINYKSSSEVILYVNDKLKKWDLSEFFIINISTSQNKQSFFENKLITAINRDNYKLNMKTIEYVDLEKEFESISTGIRSGLIVKEEIINNAKLQTGKVTWENGDWYNEEKVLLKDDIDQHLDKQREIIPLVYDRSWHTYICDITGKVFARKILAYVFLSTNEQENRNTFISQDIFPYVMDQIKTHLNSPSYSITNHPIYYINLLEDPVKKKPVLTPKMKRNAALIIAAGFKYIELFQQSIDKEKHSDNEEEKFFRNKEIVPRKLDELLEKYHMDNARKEKYIITRNGYESRRYKIDYSKKQFKILGFTPDDLTIRAGKTTLFYGSSEKYYFMEVLPLAIIAVNNNYSLDFSDYEKFITTYKPNFAPEKFTGCETLLEYLKKINI